MTPDPDTHLTLHHIRAAELQAQVAAYRLTAVPRPPHRFRVRLGWTLVEVGLRLASAPKVVIATS